MSAFDDDTVAQAVGPGRYAVSLSDRWNIGPNPNGGYVLAVIAAALFADGDKPDPLSLTAHYLRPASPGPGVVEVDVVRRGRRHTHLHARLVQDTERVRVVAVLGDLDAATGPTLELGPAGWVPTPLCAVILPSTSAGSPHIRVIELTVHVRARPAPGWLRARFATHLLVDGYLSEDGELWDAAGALVAQSRQLAMLLPVAD